VNIVQDLFQNWLFLTCCQKNPRIICDCFGKSKIWICCYHLRDYCYHHYRGI